MKNKFKKYCPNVFLMETQEEYSKGDLAVISTKYGKEVDVEVFNLVYTKDHFNYYSILRIEDESYAERKVAKYEKSSLSHETKSDAYYSSSKEGADFLVLAEPIKIGHHSEKRHRALIERNNKRMANSIKQDELAKESARKAEYWKNKAKDINLSMPDSLEYFTYKLYEATEHHKGLKDGTIAKEHSYSVPYAKKAVNDLTKKVEIANKLWR